MSVLAMTQITNFNHQNMLELSIKPIKSPCLIPITLIRKYQKNMNKFTKITPLHFNLHFLTSPTKTTLKSVPNKSAAKSYVLA